MNIRLKIFVLTTIAAAGVLLAAAIVFAPLRQPIGGPLGIGFWVGLTLIGSALPVRLPAGTTVSVGFAPLLAATALGGPTAAAVVALAGTFDAREMRREIPWYGTAVNHSLIAIPAVLGAVLFNLIAFGSVAGSPTSTSAPAWVQFAALVVAGATQWVTNVALAVLLASIRSGLPVRSILARDIRGTGANLVALIPLAWLMGEIFQLPNGVGWWATPLFVVPLFTTRVAYHRYVDTRNLFEQTIGALAEAVDARDQYTRGHSGRVSHIAEAMSHVMRLPENQIEVIKWAGLLHDIGKIGVRDNVLLKEGPLDREERILMNQHPVIGAKIVQPATQLAPESPLIHAHHEWFNGSGYPDGLEALDIPLGARILGVADAYEAMTSARPYRKVALTHEQAIGELRKYSGIQFDPEIVPILIGLDRETLDRHPDLDDEDGAGDYQATVPGEPHDPTQPNRPTPTERPTPQPTPERRELPRIAASNRQNTPPKRRALADDVS